MIIGVTPNSVHLLALPKEDNSIVTAEDKISSNIVRREQENRPPNDDRIRGIV